MVEVVKSVMPSFTEVWTEHVGFYTSSIYPSPNLGGSSGGWPRNVGGKATAEVPSRCK